MKRSISVFLTVILLSSLFAASGCALFSVKVPTKYSNADKYTAGNAEFEGTVDNLSVYWLYGSVTVKSHKESTVKISETANRELNDTFSLHWRYYNASDYGDVLYIYYSASGNFDFGDLQKDITVYIPENDEMSITVYSETAYVDLDMSGFENTMESLYILSNGGKVSAKIDCADEVRISGQNEDNVPEANREFLLRANEIYDIGISASYARLDVAAEYIHSGEVGTVFNDLLFHADKIKRIKLQNSTGKTIATVRDFDSIDIETFEGATELTLSPDASFELTLKEKDRFNHKVAPKSVSVEFDGVKQDGLKYTVGSADKKLTVATDSTLRIIPLPTEG